MRIFSFFKCYIFVFISVTFFLEGCSAISTSPVIQQVLPIPQVNNCKVVVLPFANNTDYDQGGKLVFRIFTTELFRSGDFLIPQEGDLRKILRQLNVEPNQQLSNETTKIIANRFDAQFVISGQVINLSEGEKAGRKNPIATLYLLVADGKSGKLLWSSYHSRNGDDYTKILHFGHINTLSKIAQVVSKEIIEAWFRKGMNTCISGQDF